MIEPATVVWTGGAADGSCFSSAGMQMDHRQRFSFRLRTGHSSSPRAYGGDGGAWMQQPMAVMAREISRDECGDIRRDPVRSAAGPGPDAAAGYVAGKRLLPAHNAALCRDSPCSTGECPAVPQAPRTVEPPCGLK